MGDRRAQSQILPDPGRETHSGFGPIPQTPQFLQGFEHKVTQGGVGYRVLTTLPAWRVRAALVWSGRARAESGGETVGGGGTQYANECSLLLVPGLLPTA